MSTGMSERGGLAFYREERIMIWLIIGGIFAVSLAVVIVLVVKAERHCMCRCDHGRCGRDIDGDDLLCDWCRSLQGEGIKHCHIPAQTVEGRYASAIVMRNPNRPEARLCAAGHMTSETGTTTASASNT